MKKLLLLATVLGAAFAAQAGSVTIGDFDNAYSGSGSSWEMIPINPYYTNSGSQIIFTPDDLQAIAGKNITGMSFRFLLEGVYADIVIDNLKVYLTETNQSSFYRPSDSYYYFDVSMAEPQFDDEYDGIDVWTYMDDEGDAEISFSSPFYYSGENNLIVTICATDLSETTPGNFYVNFYASDLDNRALNFANSSNTFEETLESDLKSDRYATSLMEAPVTTFDFEDAEAPVAAWSTLVPSKDVDVDIVGFDCYQVIGIEDGEAKIERVKAAKAGTGLVLKKSVQAVSLAPAEDAKALVGNLLKVAGEARNSASIIAHAEATGSNTYVLGESEDGKVGFARLATRGLEDGEVYLEVESNLDFIPLEGQGGTTGIDSVRAAESKAADNAYYTIMGQRVTSPTAGLYIHNGKKVIIK